MTDCVVTIQRPGANGEIKFTPYDGGADIELPPEDKVRLDAEGDAEVTLEPTASGVWAYKVREYIRGGRTFYVAVPNGPGPVDLDDLDEIDPATLGPAAELTPAWKGYVDTEDADLQAQINALPTGAEVDADVAAEAAARDAADDAQQAAIAAEAATRAIEDANIVTALAGKASVAALAAIDAELEAEALARADGDIAIELDLAMLETEVAGKASSAALADEAALARDAGNLSAGTIPDARIPAGIARDSEVAALVASELAGYQPGLEIGYSERTTSATSTQTAANATGTIGGLSVTVVGTGRPVDIRFACALAWSSVANKLVFASLMVNGGASGAASADSSPVTNSGPGLAFTRRLVLTAGVSYTFTVALYVESGGGTGTAFANGTYPMSLSVTNR